MPPKKVASPSGTQLTAASHGGGVPQGGTQELTSYVQGLLQQMQTRFEEMSNNIITRLDDMSARVDDLEKSIEELMQQAGAEDGETAAAKPKKVAGKK